MAMIAAAVNFASSLNASMNAAVQSANELAEASGVAAAKFEANMQRITQSTDEMRTNVQAIYSGLQESLVNSTNNGLVEIESRYASSIAQLQQYLAQAQAAQDDTARRQVESAMRAAQQLRQNQVDSFVNLEALNEKLLQMQGDQEAILRNSYDRQLGEYQSYLESARQSGDHYAQEQISQAINLTQQMYEMELKKLKDQSEAQKQSVAITQQSESEKSQAIIESSVQKEAIVEKSLQADQQVIASKVAVSSVATAADQAQIESQKSLKSAIEETTAVVVESEQAVVESQQAIINSSEQFQIDIEAKTKAEASWHDEKIKRINDESQANQQAAAQYLENIKAKYESERSQAEQNYVALQAEKEKAYQEELAAQAQAEQEKIALAKQAKDEKIRIADEQASLLQDSLEQARQAAEEQQKQELDFVSKTQGEIANLEITLSNDTLAQSRAAFSERIADLQEYRGQYQETIQDAIGLEKELYSNQLVEKAGLSSLLEELDRLQGKQAEIDEQNYKNRITSLNEYLAEAKRIGDRVAEEKIRSSIEIANQIRAIEIEKSKSEIDDLKIALSDDLLAQSRAVFSERIAQLQSYQGQYRTTTQEIIALETELYSKQLAEKAGLVSLQQELLRAQGNQAEIDRMNYQSRIDSLNEYLVEAKRIGDKAAEAEISQAIDIANQIRAVEAEKNQIVLESQQAIMSSNDLVAESSTEMAQTFGFSSESIVGSYKRIEATNYEDADRFKQLQGEKLAALAGVANSTEEQNERIAESERATTTHYASEMKSREEITQQYIESRQAATEKIIQTMAMQNSEERRLSLELQRGQENWQANLIDAAQQELDQRKAKAVQESDDKIAVLENERNASLAILKNYLAEAEQLGKGQERDSLIQSLRSRIHDENQLYIERMAAMKKQLTAEKEAAQASVSIAQEKSDTIRTIEIGSIEGTKQAALAKEQLEETSLKSTVQAHQAAVEEKSSYEKAALVVMEEQQKEHHSLVVGLSYISQSNARQASEQRAADESASLSRLTGQYDDYHATVATDSTKAQGQAKEAVANRAQEELTAVSKIIDAHQDYANTVQKSASLLDSLINNTISSHQALTSAKKEIEAAMQAINKSVVLGGGIRGGFTYQTGDNRDKVIVDGKTLSRDEFKALSNQVAKMQSIVNQGGTSAEDILSELERFKKGSL